MQKSQFIFGFIIGSILSYAVLTFLIVQFFIPIPRNAVLEYKFQLDGTTYQVKPVRCVQVLAWDSVAIKKYSEMEKNFYRNLTKER